jgi:hypothetical protein
LVAGSIPAGGAYKNKDLDEPLVPPVIKKGLVPRNGEESAAGQGDLVRAGPPAHRVQLARALADAVVGAIEAGDAEGAKVAVGMLERVVGMMGEGK